MPLKKLMKVDMQFNYLNCQIETIDNFELFNNFGHRTIIKIKKIKESERKSIRSYDKIIKKPLQKRNKSHIFQQK